MSADKDMVLRLLRGHDLAAAPDSLLPACRVWRGDAPTPDNSSGVIAQSSTVDAWTPPD